MDGQMGQDRPVRVVIVDDTRTIRAMIRSMLSRSPLIDVVGEAGDPYEARELIRVLDPDVITLDVVMPKMDGLSFLEKIMKLRPMPVVMVSTRTTENSEEAVRALSIGAVDCVDIAALADRSCRSVDLAETVLMAAGARPRQAQMPTSRRVSGGRFRWNGRTVVIGSSTGGVDALMTVLSHYPVDGPPTVIAQHMPPSFLRSFTRRLDQNSAPRVVLAEDEMTVEQGTVYVAPGGDSHVALSAANRRVLKLVPDTGVHAYVPSVDVLFSSTVSHAKHMIGVMLTGMGRDGAEAMRRMRDAGAHTIVQSGETTVVDGMPGAARALGAASEVVGLNEIGARILENAAREERAPR